MYIVSDIRRSIFFGCSYFIASICRTFTRFSSPRFFIISDAICADAGFSSRHVICAFFDLIAATNPNIGIGPHPASTTSKDSEDSGNSGDSGDDSVFASNSFNLARRTSIKAEVLSVSNKHADAFVDSRAPSSGSDSASFVVMVETRGLKRSLNNTKKGLDNGKFCPSNVPIALSSSTLDCSIITRVMNSGFPAKPSISFLLCLEEASGGRFFPASSMALSYTGRQCWQTGPIFVLQPSTSVMGLVLPKSSRIAPTACLDPVFSIFSPLITHRGMDLLLSCSAYRIY